MINITFVIILITAGISIMGFSNQTLISQLIFNPYKIQVENQYYRLVTSGFIHADWMHLIFNMISLFFFGSIVENNFSALFGSSLGNVLYIFLYILGLALSDVYSLITQNKNIYFNSLGASGAVSAVIYSAILFSPLDKIYFSIIPIGIPGFIYGPLYLLYCSYASRQENQHINHNAHLWGSVVGIVFTILIYPSVVPEFFGQISQWRSF